MSDEKNNKKEIQIISDNGSTLNISPVYEHITAAKPKIQDKKPKNIIVPKNKKIKPKK